MIMAIITNNIYVDMVPGGVLKVLHIPQGDAGERDYIFRLTNGGEVLSIPSGYTAKLEGKRKGEQTGFTIAGVIDASRTAVTITADSSLTATPGTIRARIEIAPENGAERLYSESVLFIVEANPNN